MSIMFIPSHAITHLTPEPSCPAVKRLPMLAGKLPESKNTMSSDLSWCSFFWESCGFGRQHHKAPSRFAPPLFHYVCHHLLLGSGATVRHAAMNQRLKSVNLQRIGSSLGCLLWEVMLHTRFYVDPCIHPCILYGRGESTAPSSTD